MERFRETAIKITEEHFDEQLCSTLEQTLIWNIDGLLPREAAIENCYAIVRRTIFQDLLAHTLSLRESSKQFDKHIVGKFVEGLLSVPLDVLERCEAYLHLSRHYTVTPRWQPIRHSAKISRIEPKSIVQSIAQWISKPPSNDDNLRKIVVDNEYPAKILERLTLDYEEAMKRLQYKNLRISIESIKTLEIALELPHRPELATDFIKKIEELSSLRHYSRIVELYRSKPALSYEMPPASLNLIAEAYLKINDFGSAQKLLAATTDWNGLRAGKIITALESKYSSSFLRPQTHTSSN